MIFRSPFQPKPFHKSTNFRRRSQEYICSEKCLLRTKPSGPKWKKSCSNKKRAGTSTVPATAIPLTAGECSHTDTSCPVIVCPSPSSHTHGYQTIALTWAPSEMGAQELLCSELPQPTQSSHLWLHQHFLHHQWFCSYCRQ